MSIESRMKPATQLRLYTYSSGYGTRTDWREVGRQLFISLSVGSSGRTNSNGAAEYTNMTLTGLTSSKGVVECGDRVRVGNNTYDVLCVVEDSPRYDVLTLQLLPREGVAYGRL